MSNELSSGIKISITRSITHVFEQYMESLEWNEAAFSHEAFIHHWKDYIQNHASWYIKVNEDIKTSPDFHEYIASKMNEVIDRILSEAPTKEQIEEIEKLEKQTGKEYTFSCKAEAKYILNKHLSAKEKVNK
jgi:hypothetical protein